MLDKIKIKAEYLGLCKIDSCFDYLTDTNTTWELFIIEIPSDYYTADSFLAAIKQEIVQHINKEPYSVEVTTQNIEIELEFENFDISELSRLRVSFGQSFLHSFGCVIEDSSQHIPILFDFTPKYTNWGIQTN